MLSDTSKTAMATVSQRIRTRHYQIFKCLQSGKPEMIDSFDSSRTTAEFNLPEPDRAQETVEECGSLKALPDSDQHLDLNKCTNMDGFDDDLSAKLPYIVKEKLRRFANDIRRRTSEMTEEMNKDSVLEEVATARSAEVTAEHRPSLMSLIGLQRITDAPKMELSLRSILFTSPINPRGYRYLIWLFALTSTFLYNALVIPLRSTYPYQTEKNLKYWFFFDYICDLAYIVDIIFVKPRLTFMRGGIPVVASKETRKNYLTNWTFKLDLMSLIPLDFMYFWTGPVAAWRFSRLLKISTYWELFDLLDNSFSTAILIRLSKTFFYMLYIIHCNSCLYYMISAWEGFGQIAYHINGRWYINKWAYTNKGNAYIRCFYLVASVATSIGNNPAPTNVIEYIYMTFSWMMGVFVFAVLLGQIKDIVSNANRNREQYRQTMDAVLGECNNLQLPKATIDRVRDWFNYTWQQQKTLDEQKLIEKLPLKLQTDLALSVHYNTFSKVQLFQDCDRALIRELVLKLRPVIYLPGDWICKKGDVGKEMYIVNDGILQIIGGPNNETVFAELTEGSAFGEISLLAIGGNNRRTANIRSKGYSTLFVLSKEDLNDAIKDYPEAQKLLKKKAKQMLNKDKKPAENDTKHETKSLEEMCRVSTRISTPRLLNTVVKVLPRQSLTYQHLQHLLRKEKSEELKYGRTVGKNSLQMPALVAGATDSWESSNEELSKNSRVHTMAASTVKQAGSVSVQMPSNAFNSATVINETSEHLDERE